MTENEWPKFCNLHKTDFLSGVSGAI